MKKAGSQVVTEQIERLFESCQQLIDMKRATSFSGIALKCHFNKNYFGDIKAKGVLSGEFLDALVEKFPEINRIFIETGEGEPIKKVNGSTNFLTTNPKPMENTLLFKEHEYLKAKFDQLMEAHLNFSRTVQVVQVAQAPNFGKGGNVSSR